MRLKGYIGCLLFLSFFSLSLSAQIENEWTKKRAKQWVKDRTWDNGLFQVPDKSINPVSFATQYNKNKELWDKAFLFLKNNDLKELAVGDYVIEEGLCWATVSEYIPKTADEAKIESHKQFIDLQYILYGNEKMGVAKKKMTVQTPYNEKRDVVFYVQQKMSYSVASSKVFFLFFPDDIHQPSVLNGKLVQSRKIVIKIEYKD